MNRPRISFSTLVVIIVAILVILPKTSWWAARKLEQRQIVRDAEAIVREARLGNAENVELLLRAGVSVDASQEDGVTALMKAAEKNHGELVSVLLSHGASVTAVDSDGKTALRYAVDFECVVCAEKILGAKGDVRSTDRLGDSIEKVAHESGNAALIQLIEKASAGGVLAR